MIRPLLALVVACIATLLTVPASAAIIPVTTPADTLDGGDGLTSLREAITLAGSNGVDDTIVLTVGETYALSYCVEGPLTFTEATGLVIQGNDSTVQQTCPDAGMVTATDFGSSLALEQVTLIGGPNTGVAVFGAAVRAAVRAAGLLDLDQVVVTGVDAGGETVIEGGMDHSTNPYRLEIANSSFHHNKGSIVGGDNTSTHIVDTEIVDNQGSAINLADGWPLLVENSTVARNTGAGISSTGQGFTVNSLTVIDSVVEDNARVGIFCSNCGTLLVRDSTIQRNGLDPARCSAAASTSRFRNAP